MSLKDRVADLSRRVAVLEAAEGSDAGSSAASGSGREPAEVGVNLRLVSALRGRKGPRYVRDDVAGAVSFTGAARIGGSEVLWAAEHGLPEVWDADLGDLARLLAALGHPARLALVRAVLAGAATSQELAATAGAGSTGQLYHHLKDLIAVGVVEQAGRNRYRIEPAKVVPLLVILAAAGDVARPHDAVGPEAAGGAPEASANDLGPVDDTAAGRPAADA
jgi:predicted transcriptional regulator